MVLQVGDLNWRFEGVNHRDTEGTERQIKQGQATLNQARLRGRFRPGEFKLLLSRFRTFVFS